MVQEASRYPLGRYGKYADLLDKRVLVSSPPPPPPQPSCMHARLPGAAAIRYIIDSSQA